MPLKCPSKAATMIDLCPSIARQSPVLRDCGGQQKPAKCSPFHFSRRNKCPHNAQQKQDDKPSIVPQTPGHDHQLPVQCSMFLISREKKYSINDLTMPALRSKKDQQISVSHTCHQRFPGVSCLRGSAVIHRRRLKSSQGAPEQAPVHP